MATADFALRELNKLNQNLLRLGQEFARQPSAAIANRALATIKLQRRTITSVPEWASNPSLMLALENTNPSYSAWEFKLNGLTRLRRR